MLALPNMSGTKFHLWLSPSRGAHDAGGGGLLRTLGAPRGPLGLSGNGVCPRNYGCQARQVLRLFPGSPAASVLASGPRGGRGGGGQLNAGPRESREWSHGEGGPGDGSGPREKVDQVWGGREEERGQNNIMHGVPCHQTWASS